MLIDLLNRDKMMIEGKHVKFRSLELTDLSKLRDWRNSKSVRKTTREYRLLNMISQKKWFEKIYIDNPPNSLMFGIINDKKKIDWSLWSNLY